MKQEYPELMGAMRFLASRCDGARSVDGQGFNGRDTYFGKSLASQSLWSIKQAEAAYKILRTYKGQLAEGGLNYDSIPKPEEPVGTEVAQDRYIDFDGKLFVCKTPYEFNITNHIKQIAGRRWDGVNKVWTIPPSSADKIPYLAELQNIELKPAAKAKIDELVHQQMEAVHESEALESNGFHVDINGTPRPYQLAGAKYIVDKKRSFLADDMGTGKTVQTIMAVKHEDAYPVLVVCPASLKINWQREFKMWTGTESVIITGRPTEKTLELLAKFKNNIPEKLDPIMSFIGKQSKERAEYESLNGHKKLLDNPSVIIINYDIVDAWLPFLQGIDFKTLVCDESSNLKNGKTKRTKAISTLAKNIEYRYLLSGTPMLNRPKELISQLQILDRLQEFGGWKFFVQRYCAGQYDRFGLNANGASHTTELGDKLRATCMVRRTKAQVLTELPEKQRSFVYMPLVNRKEYDKAEADIIYWVGQQARKEQEFLDSISYLPTDEQAKLIRHHQIEAEQRAARAEHLVRIENLKTLAAKGKLDAVCEWIESFLETGEKLVIYGWHKEIVNEVAKRFNAPAITGDTPLNKRQEYIDNFQNNDDAKVICLNIKSGGMGITLTAASNTLFLEQGWTPGDMLQAEDRTHRLGQKNAVNIWYMLGEDTIDIDINELLMSKSNTINSIVGGEGMDPKDTPLLGDLMKRLKERAKR